MHAGLCVSSAPLLQYVTAFEAGEEPREIAFECWLPKGHMLEIRPGDVTLKRANFREGQVGAGEGEPQNVPGVALERLGTHEQFEAEVSRERLRQLHITSGDVVTVVFRHVRLFDHGRYTEGEVRHGRLVPHDIA